MPNVPTSTGGWPSSEADAMWSSPVLHLPMGSICFLHTHAKNIMFLPMMTSYDFILEIPAIKMLEISSN